MSVENDEGKNVEVVERNDNTLRRVSCWKVECDVTLEQEGIVTKERVVYFTKELIVASGENHKPKIPSSKNMQA